MPSKYITCSQCRWSQARLSVKPGTCQACLGCGHPFSNVGRGSHAQPKSAPAPKSVPPAPKTFGSYRNRWSKGQPSSRPQTSSNVPSSSPAPQPESTVPDKVQTDRQRFQQDIARFQASMAILDPTTDSALIQQFETKISQAKESIISAKSLDQQVTDLDRFIDRRAEKVLVLRRSINESIEQISLINAELKTNRLKLGELRRLQQVEQASKLHNAPALTPAAAPAAASSELMAMQSTVSQLLQLLQGLATAEAIPTEAKQAISMALSTVPAPVPVPSQLPIQPGGVVALPASQAPVPVVPGPVPVTAAGTEPASATPEIAMEVEEEVRSTNRSRSPLPGRKLRPRSAIGEENILSDGDLDLPSLQALQAVDAQIAELGIATSANATSPPFSRVTNLEEAVS